jgi:hypothetical protein
MNAQKRILATVVGTVVAFFGGWIIYGMLGEGLMADHMDNSLSRGEENMIWWAMIVGNLLVAYFFAYVYDHWNGGVKGFVPGLKIGVIIGLILGFGMGLMYYSRSTIYLDVTGVVIDTVLNAVWMGLIGGSVGFMYGRGE